MDNKYFTPSIEDIRVGYEMETNYLKDNWEKYVINDEYEASWFFESYKADAHPVEFRVPYLTKEQIEAEGWIFKEKRKNPWLQVELLYTKKDSDRAKGMMDGFEKEWTLYVFEATLGSNLKADITIQLDIEGGFMGIHETSIIWKGRIKDINTFRYICKLLNIN